MLVTAKTVPVYFMQLFLVRFCVVVTLLAGREAIGPTKPAAICFCIVSLYPCLAGREAAEIPQHLHTHFCRRKKEPAVAVTSMIQRPPCLRSGKCEHAQRRAAAPPDGTAPASPLGLRIEQQTDDDGGGGGGHE